MLSKEITIIIGLVIIPLMLSSCQGLLTVYPGECAKTNPSLERHTLHNWFVDKPKHSESGTSLFKEDYIKAWGKPYEVRSVTEGRETWIYKRHLWTGIVPIWVLPVPILLPLGNGYDRIEFDGDKAMSIQRKDYKYSGFVLCLFGLCGGEGGLDKCACQ
jgi:hypothetical protein